MARTWTIVDFDPDLTDNISPEHDDESAEDAR